MSPILNSTKALFYTKNNLIEQSQRTDYAASKYSLWMSIVNAIKNAQNIILSTHKSSDGDGLGSEIAMFHALHKIGKNVSFVHNDLIPSRYHFLLENTSAENFLSLQSVPNTPIDLALIFDTHDPLLCSPLFETLKEKNVPTYFIDHHIKIKNAPEDSFLLIDEYA